MYCKNTSFWELGKTVRCAKMSGPILTIYTSYDMFLRKVCLLGVAVIVSAVKKFSGVIF